MKPCGNRQKEIALLAMNLLEPSAETELRQHLLRCPACRDFLEQLSSVAERLSIASPTADIEASEGFHQRLVSRLRSVRQEEERGFSIFTWRALSSNWRIVFPLVGGTAALAIAAFFFLRLESPVASPPVTRVTQIPTTQSASPKRELAPSLSNYQMAANVSLDALDDLLTRQGNRSLPSVPIYTAANLGAGE